MSKESRIDTHLHVWDRDLLPYPWLHSRPDLPWRAGVPGRGPLCRGRVLGVVLVEAGVGAGYEAHELSWLLSLVKADPAVLGVVAAVDWRIGGVDGVIDRGGDCGLVGVRVSLAGADSPRSFARSLASAGSAGLSVDVLCAPSELDLLADALEEYGSGAVVLDHLGNPPIRQGWNCAAARSWERSLERLSTFPRLTVKLSGLPALANGDRTMSEQCAPFLQAAVDIVGTSRAMLGSDWPVSGFSRPWVKRYGDWFSFVKHSLGDRYNADIASCVARRVYSLDIVSGDKDARDG